MDLTAGLAMRTGADVYISLIKGGESKKNPKSGRINVFFYNDAYNSMSIGKYNLLADSEKVYFVDDSNALFNKGKRGSTIIDVGNQSKRLDFTVPDKDKLKRFRGVYKRLRYDEDLDCAYVDIIDNISYEVGSHDYTNRKTTHTKCVKKMEDKKMSWADEAAKIIEESKTNTEQELDNWEPEELRAPAKACTDDEPKNSGRYPWGKNERNIMLEALLDSLELSIMKDNKQKAIDILEMVRKSI